MRILIVTNMYPTREMPSFGTFVDKQVESLRREGVDVDVFFFNGRKSRINYLWAFPRLWARLLTRRYDLIHAHYVFSAIVARAQLACPVVLTQHGPEVFSYGYQARLCRFMNRLMDRVILVSEEQRERGRLNKGEVIPCGVDFDLFKPMAREEARSELGLPLDRKLVLWAGEHFRPEKRFEIVQESVALLRKRDPDVELVLASQRPLHEVPRFMNACDVLLLVSDGEGSPMVVKEAMACNLPVVAVPAGDVAEVIGGTDGCYLCSQDPEDVANKLELAFRWGQRTNGRESMAPLELGHISRRIIGLYEELIQAKAGTGLRRFCFWQRGDRRKHEAGLHC